MDLRTMARQSGVLGGLCWLGRWVLDLTGNGGVSILDALYWGGLALLGIAFVGYGASMVSRSMPWLRVIVAVAFPILAWSVLEVLHTGGDRVLLDAVVGAAVLLASGAAMVRGRGPEPDRRSRRTHGTHAR